MRPLAIACLVAAALIGFVLWREAGRPAPSGPACGDAIPCATSGVDAPRAAALAVTPTPAEPSATTTSAVSPSPVIAAPAPADGAALRADADRLIAAGEIAKGLDVFRKAVEAAPTADNHGDFGSLLYRLTAFDEAALHLQAAAELDPGNADRWIALANVQYRKVNLGEAWKAEKRAREAEPGLRLGRDSDGMRIRAEPVAPPVAPNDH